MKKPSDPPSPSPREENPRGRGLSAREAAMGAREVGMDARESATATREGSLTEREDVARLREDALRAREEARTALAQRDELLPQLVAANEKLVLASLRAEELAAEADTARHEVAASEERFRTLVTTSASIVFRAGADGAVRVDPESWLAFTGVPADASDGAAWLRPIHSADREEVRAAWATAVKDLTPFEQTFRLARRDGGHACVVARAVPLPPHGPPREWVGTITDVSDRMRVEEARDRFIAILGHDLRSPLGAIRVAADLLGRRELADADAELAFRIAKSAHRMDAMIGALLDFARGRLGGGIPIERRPCDLATIVETSVAEAMQVHPTRAIGYAASGDTAGDWDGARLEQVLSNLIGNAVRHGKDPIDVAVRGEAEHVVLTVQNAGQPVRASALPVLFEPFKARSLDDRSGLGLGLYIVSEIARAHGGGVSATSSEIEGTTFTVRLPRTAPNAG